ncbi:MAG: phosphotransferase [Rhodocyclaceae bacterium]|nr:phosphotransferase [Rhodocyclaceae bacterium]
MTPLAPLLLDDERAASLLSGLVPGYREGVWQILSCRVAQTRRRVSRRLLNEGGLSLGVVWQLRVRDPDSGRVGEQWLYGRFFSGEQAPESFLDEAASACAMPRFGRPVEVLPEIGLVLWALPNDPRIRQLSAFLDPAALARHLPPELAPDAGTAVEASIVRHEPEEHCTARFDVRRDGQRQTFFGKCYADDRWRDARDALDTLWRQSVADARAFEVGRPMGASPHLGALWQMAVSGVPLADELLLPDGRWRVEALAAALVRLQDAGPLQGAADGPGEALELAAKWRKKLVLAAPELADAADPVVSLLGRTPQQRGRQVPVHGDFHVDQMLWTGERIALFDYDNFVIGSPMRDLADCISQMLCRDDDGDWTTVAWRLMDAYRRQAPQDFDEEALDWTLRLMLLRKAYSFLVRNREGWQARAERALLLALAGMTALPPVLGRMAA